MQEAATQWRELAAQAVRNARATMDPHTKAVLLAIADEYRMLAERAEQRVKPSQEPEGP